MCSTCGCGDPAGPPSLMRTDGRPVTIRLEHDLLGHNDAVAARVRAGLRQERTFALNLVSSPGAGKTTVLVHTLRALRESDPTLPIGVIEGDQATSLDAERIRATGIAAVQVNTGAGCHLDATQVEHARGALGPLPGGLLLVENVGNLVCPAAFDLGETRRVVLASVTEGEDKPLKYPHLFATADLVLVTKLDLLPHLDLDLPALVANADRIRPGVTVLGVSARTGEGMHTWLDWLRRGIAGA